MKKQFSRRDFLKLAGGAVVTVAGVGLLPQFLRKTLHADAVVAGAQAVAPDLYFAGTDGWFWLPDSQAQPPYFPDSLAPAPFNTYIFGFRNVTGMSDTARQNQRNKAQHNAPFFWANEVTDDPITGTDPGLRMQLTNLGLALRPDLTDAHTIHWHGFRNVIPFFDGEPTGSMSVPVGQLFTYVYKPRDPGTYMFHCHVEDVEHVTMGMTGLVFVRPAMGAHYAYNDASTYFDREYGLFLSEIWSEGHWNDAHIQESDWSTFKADFSLLNGRVYPDTLQPNSPINMDKTTGPTAHALTIQTDPATGDMLTNPNLDQLQYNPHSSLITCNVGEKVLLRFANLGFREAAMTLSGIDMKVVGRDATPMKGRDGTDTSYVTNTLLFGAGESFDVIFTAPAFSGGSGKRSQGYDTYVLYNRRYTQDSNLTTFGADGVTPGGAGGQRTEVRVYPGTLADQEYLNQHPDDLKYVNGVLQI